MMSSSTPVTVTVCGVSQFADVKVSGLLIEVSELSETEIATTTLLPG